MLRTAGRGSILALLRPPGASIERSGIGAVMLLTTSNVSASPTPWARVSALALSQLVAWGTLYYAFAVVTEPI